MTASPKNIDNAKEAEYAIAMHPSGLGIGAAYEASKMITNIAFSELEME